jgi:phosphatidylserine decarboxylase
MESIGERVMEIIRYIDRETGQRCDEKVYGGRTLKLLYGDTLSSSIFGKILLPLMSRWPHFSKFYGWLQQYSFTKMQIKPFIKEYNVDVSEFEKSVDQFTCFNDFFTRKLKPEVRPVVPDEAIATIPADACYLFYPRIDLVDGFWVKGKKFQLAELLDDAQLAAKYEKGSMVIARLCPADCHRFHFPCSGFAGKTKAINGWLFAVHPIAIKKNVKLFSENKRTLCELSSDLFGKVVYMEIGATCVGTIHQTYQPEQMVKKGDEKGFFSFGGSSLVILFEPGVIQFDADLLEASSKQIEIFCLAGQSMGKLQEKF